MSTSVLIAASPESGVAVALTEIDRSLLERCLAEEPGAWKDFVDRFIGLFIHVINHSAHARSVRLSPDDIDDLCAEVFVALLADNYGALRRFRGDVPDGDLATDRCPRDGSPENG